MNKLICSGIAILFCVLCVSGVSAFTYDEEARVSPSGVLNPGENVNAFMSIIIPAGTIDSNTSVILETDLNEARWLYDIYLGGSPRSSGNQGAGNSFTITGWAIEYDEPVELKIYLTGRVPDVNDAEIKVMSITQTPAPTSGESSYSVLLNTTPAQTPTPTPTPTPIPTSTPTPTPTPTENSNIAIKSSWNFISIQKALESSKNTAGKLFGGVDTLNHSVLVYNGEKQEWEIVSEDAIIVPLTGYWIYSKTDDEIKPVYSSEPTVPATKTVYKGWNSVGVSADKASPGVNVFAGIKWRIAIPWNPTVSGFDSALVNGGIGDNSPDNSLNLKNGIWLYVEESGTMTGLTA